MSKITDSEISELKKKANDIRVSIIRMLIEAGSGHSAGALGMADIFSALYFRILKHDPKDPEWQERDRLILSNGHICPVLYAAMAHSGYFGLDELMTLRKFGSRLQGHPHREWLPMLETSSGPLGCGLSQTIGMVLAEKISRSEPKGDSKSFFCMLSDGELDEGNTWEAVMLAGKEKLGSLIAIIDRNNIQIDGPTENVMPLEPLRHKWEAFGWHVLDIDGHDFKEITSAVEDAKKYRKKPSVIIARTTPGRGVSFMENKFEWHGKVPTKEEGERALKELGIRS